MIITLTSSTDRCATITFTWSDDMQDCSFVAIGEHDIDAIMQAKGHEGADVDGYATDARWS